jgi:simple sugar transport system permease protein
MSVPDSTLPRHARKRNNLWGEFGFAVLLPSLAVVAALAIGAILLLLLRVNPLTAYAALIGGAFGDASGLTQSVVKATPLLFVGLGIVIAFRANVINIGAEGQLMLGALASTWFALTFRTWPSVVLIPATLCVSFVAGAAWGLIPGLLKARLHVNEILSTVMMNAIAQQLMNLLLRGPLIDPAEVAAGTFIAQSERLPAAAWLPRLLPQTQLHAGAILAVLLAGAVYIFLWRTTIGYRLRAVGQNPEAARYAGIRVAFYQALALTLAGGFAGLAGGAEILGVHHRLLEGISGGYGFTGIVAALFGKLHPLGLVPAAFIFGSLLIGADKMQRAVQVPSALVGTLLGVVVLFVVGSDWWVRRRAARRSTPQAESQVTAHE